jgi:hypothetical protein
LPKKLGRAARTTKPPLKKAVRTLFEDSVVFFNVDDDVTRERVGALLAPVGCSYGTRLFVDVSVLKV